MENKGRMIGRARGRLSAPRPAGPEQESSSSSSQSGQTVLTGERRPGAPTPEAKKQPQETPATFSLPTSSTAAGGSGAGGSSTGGSGEGGTGDPHRETGRGAMRGRRPLPPPLVHTRPENVITKRGSSGIPIILTANYFQLNDYTDWIVHQYRVDFAPTEENTNAKYNLLKIHEKELGGYIFDGSCLYVSYRFPKDPMELFSTRMEDGAPFRIQIRYVKQVEHGDPQYLQIFNLLVRKSLRMLRLQLIGRNYFDPHAKTFVPGINMELWPGYVTSIRQHESSVLMCSEITSKVMRTDTLLDMLSQVSRNVPRASLQEEFKREILGLVVLTDYNNRTYRVDDVDFTQTPECTFKKDGQDITYIQYYKERYGLRINHTSQPLIVSKSKPRELRAGQADFVYLIPELCRMTGVSDAMKEDHVLMRALADHTRVGPSARIQKLLAFNKRLRGSPNIVDEFNNWNLKVADKLVEINARVLPSETIHLGVKNNQPVKYDSGPSVDWTSQLRSNPMLQSADIKSWVVFVPHAFNREALAFVDMIKRAARGMFMRMSDPAVVTMQDDRPTTYLNHLSECLSGSRPQLVVCCVSNNKPDKYNAIKKLCCVDRPVPSQVITKRAMTNRGAMSIATKVAVQINCKLGGSPWTVANQAQNSMVFGFDVSHDTLNKRRSYGAMVASLNNNLSRYYCAVSPHENGQELSNHMAINLLKALQKFRSYNNGSLPARIFFYRDGVGDGQIKHVFDHEVEAIKTQLAAMYGSSDYRLTFIIVSKRINTRFFCNEQNPPPGTVVDDVVTLPERYDFFIVSQNVRQGSVSPTSYNVISDNSGLDPNKLQIFTYKLCHLYYNWSGTVKVPAPVQYAHKLAMLVSQNLHRVPHGELEDLLFFL